MASGLAVARPFSCQSLAATVFASLALLASLARTGAHASNAAKTYVVMLKEGGLHQSVRELPQTLASSDRTASRAQLQRQHIDLLLRFSNSELESHRQLHSYTEVVNGFSVKLTVKEALVMQEEPEVLLVAEDRFLQPQLTHSSTFLGLDRETGGLYGSTVGTDVIVGVIDTGVWPESPSFNDSGYGPVPDKWRGACEAGEAWDPSHCNRKLIGARFFVSGYARGVGLPASSLSAVCNEYLSPRDAQGHGSHVASVAAGSPAAQSLVQGFDFGRSQGVAYGARVAAYKVCWCNAPTDAADLPHSSCAVSDIIAAMDAAVADGVDVLTISIGGGPAQPGDAATDPLSYASYFAVRAGIPVVFAAGNGGPYSYTASNTPPWVMTVASSSLDRVFRSTLVLDNGTVFQGVAAGNNGTGGPERLYPLVDAEAAAVPGGTASAARLCYRGALDPSQVSGAIVLCQRGFTGRVEKGNVVAAAGGAGMVLYNSAGMGDGDQSLYPDFHALPALEVGWAQGQALRAYVASRRVQGVHLSGAGAYITRSECHTGPEAVEAPEVSSSSSAGPNGGSLSILKPDIAAPGVFIFGAWTQSPLNKGGVTASPLADGTTTSQWNILSGTSMAAPHVAGSIALLKALHPTWHPSWFYSAIMTTASGRTNRGGPIQANGGAATPFNMGAGFLNPSAAADPGLVYGLSNASYSIFLCSPDSGLDSLPSLAKLRASLCRGSVTTRAVDLNLPAISFYNVESSANSSRRLTNVGGPGTYRAIVSQASGAHIAVEPSRLTFAANQSWSFTVSVTPAPTEGIPSTVTKSVVTTPTRGTGSGIRMALEWTFGSITWSDDNGHDVRINVAVNMVGRPDTRDRVVEGSSSSNASARRRTPFWKRLAFAFCALLGFTTFF